MQGSEGFLPVPLSWLELLLWILKTMFILVFFYCCVKNYFKCSMVTSNNTFIISFLWVRSPGILRVSQSCNQGHIWGQGLILSTGVCWQNLVLCSCTTDGSLILQGQWRYKRPSLPLIHSFLSVSSLAFVPSSWAQEGSLVIPRATQVWELTLNWAAEPGLPEGRESITEAWIFLPLDPLLKGSLHYVRPTQDNLPFWTI